MGVSRRIRYAYGILRRAVRNFSDDDVMSKSAALSYYTLLSFAIGAVQRPDERRVHTQPTALLDGAAILLGVLAGLGIALKSTWAVIS